MKTKYQIVIIFCILNSVSIKSFSQEYAVKNSNATGFNFLNNNRRVANTEEFGLWKLPITVGLRNMGTLDLERGFYGLFSGVTANYYLSKHVKPLRKRVDIYAGGTYGFDLSFIFLEDFVFAYRRQPFLQGGTKIYISKRFGIYGQYNLDLSPDQLYQNTFEAGLTFRGK